LPDFKKIKLSGPAQQDLLKIAEYTKQTWGAAQKKKYLAQIKSSFKALGETPGLGKPRNEISLGLLVHPVQKHVIFYRESEQELLIIRIFINTWIWDGI